MESARRRRGHRQARRARDDVAAIAAVLDQLSGPFVLVGHSYSGLPVTEIAAAREDLAHVVSITAIVIPPGNSLLDAIGGQPPGWWIPAKDAQPSRPGRRRTA